MTGSTPTRLMRGPVTKEGANMPMICDEMTNAASRYGCPHTCIAIGVDVIRKFMTPYPMAPAATATMYFGCETISRSGRPPADCSLALGVGMRIWRRSSMVAIANAMSTRYAPLDFDVRVSMDERLGVGPMKHATRTADSKTT